MVYRQVFLFIIKFYHFYIWKLLYSLPNCVMHLKKNHSFMKKVILSCLKMNLKISHKGFKKSKIDF